MKKTLILISVLVILSGGIFIGYKIFSPQKKLQVTINSQVILSALKKEGFLVSQTYVFDQKVEIENSSGSGWKDIFWSQKITALAKMKVSSGVDLRKLTDQDIEITNRTITIFLPPIERHSTELMGDINLINKQGLLKKLFDNDDGYNLAYERLREESEKAASSKELRQEAEENTKIEIEKLLRFFDTNKTIKIEFQRIEA